ncbi:MAG: TetR/AcrR family transcriptional regulator [Oscillospiraceae bacterium]|nr:TetR/AcrR family transcriptional regulator [Oscillospiraceae bacterium]
MARGARSRPTKEMIIQLASKLYIENGFSATDNKQIAVQLGISNGNLTFYFPQREYILKELVKELCDFQWRMIEIFQQEDYSPLLALCIEFAAMASIAEENAAMRDVYVSAYTYPMALAVIRENDVKKTQMIFSEFCPDWTEEQFAITENFYSGIEYGMFSSLGNSGTSLDQKVSKGLDSILQLYNVPKEVRDQSVEKIIVMDYRNLGRRLLSDFKDYITAVNWHAVETARQNKKKS